VRNSAVHALKSLEVSDKIVLTLTQTAVSDPEEFVHALAVNALISIDFVAVMYPLAMFVLVWETGVSLASLFEIFYAYQRKKYWG